MKREDATMKFLDHPERLTLWSFIKYVAHKHNPNTARRFHKTMREELQKLHRAGIVATCRSIRGKRSYRKLPDAAVPF